MILKPGNLPSECTGIVSRITRYWSYAFQALFQRRFCRALFSLKRAFLVNHIPRVPHNERNTTMKSSKLILAAVLAAATSLTALTGCSSNGNSSSESTSSESVSSSTASTAESAPADEDSTVSTAQAATAESAATAEADDEDYNTGDASLDNPRNQDGIGENELLVLSFGTSFNDSRRLTIGAIENDLETAFPDYSVRRGFTANIVIDHVNRRDGEKIDDIGESLDRAVANGVKNLVVQPTHLMNGLEYDELCGKIADYSDAFEKVFIGDPLLTSDEDFQTVADAIVDWTKDYDDGETAVVFMGHGTEAESNAVYQKMQDLLTSGGHTNYFVGTVEATPSLDDVIAAVKAGEYKKVVLEPLMVVAGDHANNDMAGDEDDSWKSAFEKEGYEVTCLLRGLGENETIRQLYVAHAQAAVDAISNTAE